MKLNKSRVVLLIILGLVIGYLAVPFVHEAGHYAFACAVNCSAITNFTYKPQVALTQFTFSANNTAYEVRYAAPVKSVYGDYGILVYMGGFAFEIVLFVIAVLLLRKYSRKLRTSKDKQIFLFLLGFFTVFVNSSVTWIVDFVSLMRLYTNLDFLGIQVVVYSLITAIYFIWFVFMMGFIRILGRN